LSFATLNFFGEIEDKRIKGDDFLTIVKAFAIGNADLAM
jgi:hypothetical protein